MGLGMALRGGGEGHPSTISGTRASPVSQRANDLGEGVLPCELPKVRHAVQRSTRLHLR